MEQRPILVDSFDEGDGPALNQSDKWPMPDGALVMYFNDGKDTVCILKSNGRDYLGYAVCGKRDTFDEILGMAISLGRACKKYHIRNNRHQARESNHAQPTL